MRNISGSLSKTIIDSRRASADQSRMNACQLRLSSKPESRRSQKPLEVYRVLRVCSADSMSEWNPFMILRSLSIVVVYADFSCSSAVPVEVPRLPMNFVNRSATFISSRLASNSSIRCFNTCERSNNCVQNAVLSSIFVFSISTVEFTDFGFSCTSTHTRARQ